MDQAMSLDVASQHDDVKFGWEPCVGLIVVVSRIRVMRSDLSRTLSNGCLGESVADYVVGVADTEGP